MRHLKTNTATKIVIGPFLDSTDGVTPETSLTVTGMHLTLVVDNAGTPTLALDADATASGGNNDVAHVTNDDAGLYTVELTAAQLNYLGGAILTIVVSGALPVFHELTILPAQVYDSLIAGTDLLDANASQLGGTTQTGNDVGADVNDILADTNELQTDDYPTSIAAVKSDTAAILTDTADMQPKLGTPAGVSISADIAAIEAQTDDIGVAGAGLTALATQASVDVIDNFLDTEIAAILADTNELQTDWADGGRLDLILDAASAPSAAAVADAVWDEALAGHAGAGSAGEALSAAGTAGDPWTTSLPGAYGAGTAGKIIGDNINAPIATVDSVVDGIATEVSSILADTGTDGVVVAAASKTGYALSAAGIQAIWDALTSALTTAGSIGKRIVDYLTGDIFARLGAPAGASTAADIAAIKAETASILTDTGTTLDAALAVVDANVDAILADTADMQPKLGTPAGASISADIAAIEAQTDDIGAAGAGLTALASQASVTAIDDLLDTEIAAILEDTGTTIPAQIAALNNLSSAQAQTAAAAALTAYDPPTAAELISGLSGLNDLSAAEVNAEVVDVLRTDTIPDSVAADGAQPTIAQAVYALLQMLTEKSITGTTLTVKKPDGTTALMTFTLDDASAPTAITRAS